MADRGALHVTVVATALALCVACTAEPSDQGDTCTQPLDGYCSDCPSFEAALDVALTHGEAPAGWGAYYGGDVFVWQCEGGTNIIEVMFAGSLAGRVEYYDSETGRLIGAMIWSDTPMDCGQFYFLYGDSVPCTNACLLGHSCLPEDDPLCVEFVTGVVQC